MKKIYFIGDCHLSRVSEHFNENESKINLIFWGKAAKKIYDLDFKKMYEENELSSGKEEQKFPNDGVIPFSDIKDDGILFSWFGYVDIRTFLSKYKNADLVAKKYINDLVNNFPNSKIIIIEPLPQFTEMLLKYEGISPSYTYEERLEQNKLFLESMYKYAKIAGIENFITQDEIYNAIGSTKLTPEMSHNKAPHPVDGLKDEYNKKILELFYRKAEAYLNE
jgi:hypothetical protein